MSVSFIAAVLQLVSGPDRSANLDRVEALAGEAAARSAQLVVLPEIFSWRGPRRGEAEAAEPIPGPTSDHMSRLARELGIYLVAGSILERVEPDMRFFNTCVVFDPKGSLIARYRKIHLFDVDLPGKISIRESDGCRAGDRPVVANTALGALGLSICYDLRFPELYRRLVRTGAEIFCVPSAFTSATGTAHWAPLLRARAIENQSYVLAPNQSGHVAGPFEAYGHSMIVDPWGVVLGQAADGEAVLCAELNLDDLRQVRRELPCLDHIVLAS